jgi:hypothetical protein
LSPVVDVPDGVADAEAHFGHELNLADLPPEELSVLGPLCRHVQRTLLHSGSGMAGERP